MIQILLFILLCTASTACAEVFTWKDRQGITHYTNSVYEIPARYLSRARVLDIATGKKSPLTPGQLSGQSQPAAGGSGAAAAAPPPALVAPQPAPQPDAAAVRSQPAPAPARSSYERRRKRIRSYGAEEE